MNIFNNIPVNDLTNIGFECAINGLQDECEAICQGIELADGNSAIPQILRAISNINGRQYDEALAILKSIIPKTDEEKDYIKSLTAMSRVSKGDIHIGNTLLKEIASNSKSQASVNLATHLLSMD